MYFRAFWNCLPDFSKAGLDLRSFQRNGTTESKIVVAHCDEPTCSLCHATGRPSLDNPKWSKPARHVAGGDLELGCVFKSYVEPAAGVFGPTVKTRQVFVEVENDVVDGAAMGKTPVIVELGGVLGRVGGALFFMIGERTAVPKNRKLAERWPIQTKKASSAVATEAHGLGFRVLSADCGSSDYPTRNKHAIVRRIAHDLMGVDVIPIRLAICGVSVAKEIVTGINVIETVCENELHLEAFESLRSS